VVGDGDWVQGRRRGVRVGMGWVWVCGGWSEVSEGIVVSVRWVACLGRCGCVRKNVCVGWGWWMGRWMCKRF
jgi:hypothetical protein